MAAMSSRRLAVLLISVTVLLQGCAVTRAKIRQADALVAASTDRRLSCASEDHCAIDSPLLDAATQALTASTPAQPVHAVTLLDDSEAALVARINLIRAARRSIDVQTYIWDQDDTGQLVLQELVDAARRGVKVRILADQLFSFDDPNLLDRLARVHENLQVKLYNPTFRNAHTPPLEFTAGILCCFKRFNQRMHNKLLLVDDAIGITGGRNYQDRYFNWDDEFDYLDRDIMVGGPAAREMADSFALFWNHRRSVALTHLRDVNRHILADRAPPTWPTPHYAHPERVARAQDEAGDADWLNERLVTPSLRTGAVSYFSDRPAKTEDPQRRDAHEFTTHLMRIIAAAKQQVLLQTPYLVMSKRAQRIFDHLHEGIAPPRIVVSTNSLASTDAFAVYALSYKHRKRYLTDFGFEIYEMKPHAQDAIEDYTVANEDEDEDDVTVPVAGVGAGKAKRRRIPSEARGLFGSRSGGTQPARLISTGRRFGLHAKSIVIDDDIGMVGSHNFDPRSDHYNTEGGVIVYDAAFATRLQQSILRNTEPQNAWVIAPRKPVVPVLTDINQAISSVSEELPLFDLWPFRYATSYELKAGCMPLRPNDPLFFNCYEAVGDFPDVAISPKLFYTRLITAFGAGVKGIL